MTYLETWDEVIGTIQVGYFGSLYIEMSGRALSIHRGALFGHAYKEALDWAHQVRQGFYQTEDQ